MWLSFFGKYINNEKKRLKKKRRALTRGIFLLIYCNEHQNVRGLNAYAFDESFRHGCVHIMRKKKKRRNERALRSCCRSLRLIKTWNSISLCFLVDRITADHTIKSYATRGNHLGRHVRSLVVAFCWVCMDYVHPYVYTYLFIPALLVSLPMPLWRPECVVQPAWALECRSLSFYPILFSVVLLQRLFCACTQTSRLHTLTFQPECHPRYSRS